MPRRLLRKPNLTHLLLCIVILMAGTFLTSMQTVQASLAQSVAHAPSSPNGLLINEIYDSQSGSNEYFELLNTGAVTINLSTYVVFNQNDSIALSGLSDPVIAAGQYRAIGPAQVGDWFTGTTGIARTDFLGLVNTSPTDTVIDVVNFGGSPNPNWPNYERFRTYFFTSNIPLLPAEDGTRSLQRWPDGNDNDVGSDFAAIFSSPSAPSCGDPYETDDTAGTASTQAIGSTVLHRLCPGSDQDWIALSLSATSTYTLRANAQGASVDTVLRLYDSSGALIVEDNNPASRDSLINFRPTSGGTFRVQIVDANGQGNAGPAYLYTFTALGTLVPTTTPTVQTTPTSSTVTPTPIPCQDRYEPDDSRDTAKPLELNTTSQRHSLCPVGDVDWLTFTAGGGKVFSMFTSDLSGPIDTVITLYDSQGRFLAENDDYQPGSGLSSRIDYTFYGSATYFLRVRDTRGSGGFGYEYSIGLSSQGALPPTGTATATSTTNPNSPTPTMGPCGDTFEQDGLPSSAKDILIGTTQRHLICPTGDADWVRFYARAGKVYTIRTANLGPGLDTYMYLFDTNGSTILAQNDDGGDGIASRIDFYPLRDDYYFAQVKNAGDIGGAQLTYDLILTVAPGVPQPPGTATAGPPPPGGSTPTTVVQRTNPPVPSPTSGLVQPTPIVQQTIAPPIPQPVGTTQPPAGGGDQIPPPQPTGQLPPAPTLAVPTTTLPVPGPTIAVPTVGVPNVPRTGHPPDESVVPLKPIIVQPAKPSVPGGIVNSLPVSFRIFYDHNRNSLFDLGEGISGVSVYFVKHSGDRIALGSLTTSEEGFGILSLVKDNYRIVVPYFGLDMPLKDFPGSDAHKLWLPKVALPDRVP